MTDGKGAAKAAPTAEQGFETASAYFEIAESTDSKIEAYAKGVDIILALMAADSTLTNGRVGAKLQPPRGESWVRELLKWRRETYSRGDAITKLPFAHGRGELARERKVPTRPEDRVEMAKTLLADDKVAKAVARTVTDPKTKAGRVLSQAIHTREREQRERYAKAAQQKALDEGLPLPAHVSRIVVRLGDWALGLAGMRSEGVWDDLPDGPGRESVAKVARQLEQEARRTAELLEGPAAGSLEVEDGDVIDMDARRVASG